MTLSIYQLPNLAANVSAGVVELATAVVGRELAAAGIPSLTAYPNLKFHEVSARTVGVLEFPKGIVFGIQRASSYYAVRGTHSLPCREAVLLNRTWGSQVRINGDSGGNESVPGNGVSSWHIDSLQGLEALALSLREFFGNPSDPVVRSVKELVRLNVLRDCSAIASDRP